MWISQKTRLHEACKLHYEKKIIRGDHTLNPRTSNLSRRESSPSQKLSLGRPLESLKRSMFAA